MTFVVVEGAHLLNRTHLGKSFIFLPNKQCLLTSHCLGYLWNFEVLQTFFGCKWFRYSWIFSRFSLFGLLRYYISLFLSLFDSSCLGHVCAVQLVLVSFGYVI